MTAEAKRAAHKATILSATQLRVEINKTSRGASVAATPIIAISDLSDTSVTLLSHYGRLVFSGDGISVSVLDNAVVEIFGKITEVRLSYGKD